MPSQSLIFLPGDHFRPRFTEIEIIVLRHFVKSLIECDSISPQGIFFLEHIKEALEAEKIPSDLANCPAWVPTEREDV